MLNYHTLEYKAQQSRNDKDGKSEQFKDLLTKTWDEWGDLPYIDPVVVNQYYVARPDLISLAVYGTDEYGDMICKFNGISNPFELNEDMVLLIPPIDWASSKTSDREVTACELISDDETETIQKKDVLYKLRSDARSSSTITVGDPKPFVIDKSLGLVFY